MRRSSSAGLLQKSSSFSSQQPSVPSQHQQQRRRSSTPTHINNVGLQHLLNQSNITNNSDAKQNNKLNVILGELASYLPPNMHVSMLVHPDGIALYAKLQTDPYFRESAVAPLLQQQQEDLEWEARYATLKTKKQKEKFLKDYEALLLKRKQEQEEAVARSKDIRAQLASNKAVVDVARAAYQHPVTAPVLRFPLQYDATAESVSEEAVSNFLELLKNHSYEKDEIDVDDLLPTKDPEDLELYVYHVEDPDLYRKDYSVKGSFANSGDDGEMMMSAVAAKAKAAKAQNLMQEIIEQQQQQGQSRAHRVNHTSISIGDYKTSPPVEKEIPLRIQLQLFQLISASRKRRRKFIVRSGLHPSSVEECSPLNIYAVLTVSPFWLERRALEIQEQTAREDVAKSQQKFFRAIREAHAVSYNRAIAKARGLRQLRAFQGQVEDLFLKLAVRSAAVKQASMTVQDVVAKHMRWWPQTMKMREAMFQQELKKRRCLVADSIQHLRLKQKITDMSAFDDF